MDARLLQSAMLIGLYLTNPPANLPGYTMQASGVEPLYLEDVGCNAYLALGDAAVCTSPRISPISEWSLRRWSRRAGPPSGWDAIVEEASLTRVVW